MVNSMRSYGVSVKFFMKYIIVGSLICGFLTSCTSKSDYYYLNNPTELVKILNRCIKEGLSSDSILDIDKKLTSNEISLDEQKNSSDKLSNELCNHFKSLYIMMQEEAHDLQLNPQDYGLNIIKLQEKLEIAKSLLNKGSDKPKLEKEIEKITRQLRIRLAIVKWLETPES